MVGNLDPQNTQSERITLSRDALDPNNRPYQVHDLLAGGLFMKWYAKLHRTQSPCIVGTFSNCVGVYVANTISATLFKREL
jgi:hypothetical protein